MNQLTPQALEVREQRMKEIAEKFGEETLKAWMSHPVRSRLINAMCQIEADDEKRLNPKWPGRPLFAVCDECGRYKFIEYWYGYRNPVEAPLCKPCARKILD